MHRNNRSPGTAPLPLAAIVAASLAVLLLLLPAPRAETLGPDKPWLGGLYAGTCGFSAATGLPAAEYLAAGLFLEPLALPVLNPALSGGVLLPLAPCNAEGIRLQLSGELTIADLPARGLKGVFYNSLCWSPGVGGEALVDLDFSAATYALYLSPLRFRAGDGVFTLGSVHIFLGPGPAFAGWGATLFQAALFLF